MRPSDLIAGGSGPRGSRSPGRNSIHRHHQSIDDSQLNYHHGQSTATDPGIGGGIYHSANKTDAFYRAGKTAGDTRNTSNRGGYGTSTNPGSSVDEVNHHRPSDFKSPSSRINQNSYRAGHQTSDEALPNIQGQRHLGSSVNK